MDDLTLSQHLAIKFHEGQKYGDEDYTVHLVEVDNNVVLFFPGDMRLRILAWLHDTLEDTALTEQTLRTLFDGDIVDAVVAMTHVKGESREQYLARVKSNHLARVGKLADSYANLTRSLMRGDMKRIKKYGEYIAYLAT